MEDSEEIQLRLCTQQHVANLWHWVEPGVQRVIDKCPDDFSAVDVYWSLRENRSSLFLVFLGREYRGFFTVEVNTEPFKGRRTFYVWLMHFLGAKEVRDELDGRIQLLARHANCCRVHFKSPRRGWEKEASRQGYKLKLITWEKHV